MVVFCSDVAGAFDKVPAERLLEKLRTKGVQQRVLNVLRSWLSPRRAHAVVEGQQSTGSILENMVFQGTVWGPSFRNTYFEDSRRAVNQCGFEDVVYADDLNCFKLFDRSVSNQCLLDCMVECQEALRLWSAANQVTCDPAKESMNVLSFSTSHGNTYGR